MRALVCHRIADDFSGVEVRDVPLPEPGPDEVRVRVRAASVNFPDLLLTQGKYQLKLEPPFTPGMDFSGVVDKMGEGAEGPLRLGHDVAGGSRFGAFAEFVVVPADALQKKPPAMGFAEAAAYPAAYLTAYVALVRRANLQPGETLLVHGASGGVGLAAVDVGKLLGATVIATGASDEKLDLVVDYGADYAINVMQGFRDKVKTLTGGRGADVIFDPVGGDVFDESVRCIAFGGRLLVIGFTSGRIATVATNMPLIKGFSVVGVRAGEYGRQFPDKGRENVETIWDWAREGKTHPRVHASFQLEDALDAFAMLRDRKVVGKVVVTP
ncbi:NADPH:quinone oxidoreductase family protein [Hyphomonas johnsonii]|uniref:Zinc-binding dehydrogenase family oxidoreductase n=1 Tax=Hyphomonas johnsonii MHS-2 TaxID=1280950 RepID=A0A059FJ70_9PROT|nr:NADPH:quinone oxidoreductase family protein [Hyphomonas johnsonii]KCZ90689.1 zinc-binding dehydrogenase family oxidoreductase [Hyphomonas johnsonii MHS-2]